MTPQNLADALVRPRRVLPPDPTPPDHLVKAGDGEVAVFLEGPAEAPLRALLVHGWEADHRDLAPLAEALARRGVFCVLPDLPAHGASTGQSMTIPEGAAGVAAVAQLHGPFDLCVGHSMGAAIVLTAIRAGLRPRQTAFMAPPLNYVQELTKSARAAGAPDPLIDAALARLEQRCTDLRTIDSTTMAAHLTMPGLVAAAGNDRVVDPGNGRALAALWSGGRLIEAPEASHRSILHDAAVIAAICDLVTEAAVAASVQ